MSGYQKGNLSTGTGLTKEGMKYLRRPVVKKRPTVTPHRPDEETFWREQAVCSTTDPETFFPEQSGSTLPAKAVCNGTDGQPPCPVREQCLEWAVNRPEMYGVWGGKSETERAAIRRASRVVLDNRMCPNCGEFFRPHGLGSHLRGCGKKAAA